MIRLERPGDLDLERYRRVAAGGERVAIAPALLDEVESARAPMLARIEDGAVAYGVTTGLGHLARTAIPAAEQRAFQRSLLMRGAGTGPPLPPDVARGALLIRLAGFLHGVAGVSAALCATIADRLNDGWAPVVPSQGITSAGEVIALSHLVQPLLGAGDVLVDGELLPAAAALDRAGAVPYVPGLKEGIALINGAPLAPALGAHLGARALALLDAATVAGALTATLAGQSSRPYAPRIGRLKGEPAQVRVLERLAALGAGTGFEDRPQGPVSFRVLPQIHGAVLELAERLEELVDRELRGVTDSPLFLPEAGGEPAGFFPSGNFHPAAITLALDGLTAGVAQVGNLALQRIHRLLDARYTGLTDQLAVAPGRQSGVTFAHKAALSHVVELRRLAAPAGVQMFDGSTGQEDVQSMAFVAADQLGRALDALERVLAAELVAARQARHLRRDPLPPALEAAVARVAAVVPPVEDDRSLATDLAAARDLLRMGLT